MRNSFFFVRTCASSSLNAVIVICLSIAGFWHLFLCGIALKIKIRDRAGRYTYSLGLLVICFSILVFGILGALEVIDNTHMIVLYLSGYLLFQVIAGIVIFNKLMKKY